MDFRIRFIVIILFSSLFLSAQLPNFNNLNIESGMSSNYIRTIYKDSRGLIWIGTDTGLDSYDGIQIVNYGKRFKTPLKGAVQSIIESSDGSLWIGNEQGAFLYKKITNIITFVNFNEPTINVRKIIRAANKRIYFGTEKGLFVLDSVSFKTHPILLNINANESPSITDIIEDNKQKLWISSFEGLYSYDINNKQIEFFSINDGYGSNKIRSIANLGNDKIALGTENAAFIFDIKTKRFSAISGTENKVVSTLAANKEELYIGTDANGILVANLSLKSISTFYSSIDPLFSILYDNNGLLWCGSFNEGVNYFNLIKNNRFKTIDFYNKYKINIRSFYFAPKGDIYIGARNGFYIFTSDFQLKKTFQPFITPGLRSRIITTISPYPGNPDLLLIGTFGGGAVIFDIKTYKFYDISNNLTFQKGTIYKFQQDKHNNIWIATLSGLFKYNVTTKILKEFDLTKIIGNNELFSLNIDNFDRLWIGTSVGFYFYSLKDNRFVIPKWNKTYQYQSGPIYSDKSNNIWFCFNKGGVLKVDSLLNVKQWITTEMGLPENAPSSLIEDNNNNLWVGTQKGLYRVNKNGEIRPFGYEDGLSGLTFCPGSATKDSNGNIWWANEKGLVTFNKEFNSFNKSEPTILFTDLYINGTRYSVDTLDYVKSNPNGSYEIILYGKSKNNLEFRFAALNYHNSKMNLYSYYTEGIDKSWSTSSKSNKVSFKDLPTGEYILKVLAANNDGVWTSTPTEIKFTVTPYFYETAWFILIIIVIAGGIVLYFTRNYIIRVKAKIRSQFEDMKKKQTTSNSLKISEAKTAEIKEKIISYMLEHKPFLNPELRQADVSTGIGHSVHEISHVLNSELNQNFSDFVNSYRVEEVKIRMQTDDAKKYTLTAMAMQCGFSAKSSFLRAFKKATNMTPSEYFKGAKLE